MRKPRFEWFERQLPRWRRGACRGRCVLHDHPRPHPGRVPGHEHDHGGTRLLRDLGRQGRRRAGRQDLRSVADVDQLRPRRGGGFCRHASRFCPPLDRERSRQTRQARSGSHDARQDAQRRPHRRGATFAIQPRQARRRQCAAGGERLEEHERASARSNQARRKLGDARPLCRQGRRANRSAGQLYRRRRIHLSPIGAQCGRARYQPQCRRHGSGSAVVGPGRVGLDRPHHQAGRRRVPGSPSTSPAASSTSRSPSGPPTNSAICWWR